MAIVYQHRRNDTNDIFYIGIGDGNRDRHKSKSGRNKHWKNIVNKYGYTIELLFTDVTIEEARQIEMYLIKYYGRADLGLGNLVNMTDGGELNTGLVQSDYNKQQASIRMSGENHPFYGKKRPEHSKLMSGENHPFFNTDGTFFNKKHSEHTKNRMRLSSNTRKMVINNKTGEIHNSIIECSNKIGINRNSLIYHLSGKNIDDRLLDYTYYIKNNNR